MISAHQLEIIGLLSEGGDTIHVECLDGDVREEAYEEFQTAREQDPYFADYRYWEILEDNTGYRPLSRYDVGNDESERASEFERAEVYIKAAEELDRADGEVEVDWAGDEEYTVTITVNAGPSIWMTCDICHRRIE